MNRPRLSICIPTYNFGRFIGETLDSILPQATEDVEVTVVDGASTDNTADIVENASVGGVTCPTIDWIGEGESTSIWPLPSPWHVAIIAGFSAPTT